MENEPERFPGFPPGMRKNFWMYPRVMDAYWHELSGSEQKVLDFILRRTWGWEKASDDISISQIERGGGKLGKGTGLSQRQIVTAVHGLEKKGYVRVRRLKGMTNEYSLVVQEMHQGSEETATGSGALNAHGTGEKIAHTIDKVPIEQAIERMYKLYSKIIRPGQRLTREAKANLTARFGEYNPRELVVAMQNASEHDEYWGNIVSTNSIAWFFASEERIATFLALGPYECSEEK